MREQIRLAPMHQDNPNLLVRFSMHGVLPCRQHWHQDFLSGLKSALIADIALQKSATFHRHFPLSGSTEVF